MNPFLVSTDWLIAHLDDENLSIVDGSWYLPTMLANGVPRNGKEEFNAQHIPGAVFFDIDEVVTPDSGLPHTLASPEIFAQKVGALGISDQDTIVVYDGMGLFSAARVWWNFRVMGAAKVVLLDGGLPKWMADRLPVEAGSAPIYPKLFNAKFDTTSTVPFEEMEQLIGRTQIADARPAGRFSGDQPEPREGMRSGHMPGATSIPFDTIVKDGHLLGADDLKTVFQSSGIDSTQPITTTCGSGVTAAVLALALETVGSHNHRVYDGSWAEWGSRDDTAIETG